MLWSDLFGEVVADASVVRVVLMNALDVYGFPLGECFDLAGQGLGEEVLYCCLSIQCWRQCFCNQVGVILTSPLMGDLVKEEH